MGKHRQKQVSPSPRAALGSARFGALLANRRSCSPIGRRVGGEAPLQDEPAIRGCVCTGLHLKTFTSLTARKASK